MTVVLERVRRPPTTRGPHAAQLDCYVERSVDERGPLERKEMRRPHDGDNGHCRRRPSGRHKSGRVSAGTGAAHNLAARRDGGRPAIKRRVRFVASVVTDWQYIRPRTPDRERPSLYWTTADKRRCEVDIGGCPHYFDLVQKMKGQVRHVYVEGARPRVYATGDRPTSILRSSRHSQQRITSHPVVSRATAHATQVAATSRRCKAGEKNNLAQRRA